MTLLSKILATTQSIWMTFRFKDMRKPKINLDVCSDACPVPNVDAEGFDPRVVNEALLHLQWDGSISQLTDEELEAYRISEIASWKDESSCDLGEQAAALLQECPEIMQSARQCALLQALGECIYLSNIREGIRNGENI